MTTQVRPIRGKVARVLNDREVALNRGSSNGVEIGMIFNITRSAGLDIADPDTGEMLGSVDVPKASVKVTTVQDRVSVAATFRTRKVNVGGSGVGLGLFEPPKWEYHYETLRLRDDSTDTNMITDSNSCVSVGDPVVQVLDSDTFEEPESDSLKNPSPSPAGKFGRKVDL